MLLTNKRLFILFIYLCRKNKKNNDILKIKMGNGVKLKFLLFMLYSFILVFLEIIR